MNIEERFDVVIMGKKLGTATSWDDQGDNIQTYYDFVSEVPEIESKEEDTLTIYQTEGKIEIARGKEGDEILNYFCTLTEPVPVKMGAENGK